MTDKKAVIIGLDGVPHDLLKHYIQMGIMPHLKEMTQNGQLLPMNSSLPEVSSVAWASFMTGKNPGEHGIMGFMEIDPSSYDFYFPNFLSLKAQPFWEELDVPTIAFNIPQTYPARAINGTLVSGFVAIDLEKAVYPRRIYDYLKKIDYQLDVQSTLATKSPDLFFANLFEVLEKRFEALRYLYDQEQWQIFIGTITETDRLHHFFFDSARDGQYHEIFVKFYTMVDNFLWEIFNKSLKEKTLFLTCSDHGFTPIETEVYVNNYLKENGIVNYSSKSGLKSITSDSRAFSLEPARIYLHLKEKYSRGSVHPKDYHAVRSEIKSLFEDLNFNGKKVAQKIFFKEEIFHGAFVDQAPDLYVLAEPGFDLKSSLAKDAIFGRSHFRGAHTYHGAHLFIYHGQEKKALPEQLTIEMIPIIIQDFISGS